MYNTKCWDEWSRGRTRRDLLFLRIKRLSTGVHVEGVFVCTRIGESDGREVQVSSGGRGDDEWKLNSGRCR